MLAFGSSEDFVQWTLLVSGSGVHITAVPLQGPRPKQNEVRPRACEQTLVCGQRPRTGGGKLTRGYWGCCRGCCRCVRAQPICRAPHMVSSEALPCVHSVITAGASREGSSQQRAGQQRPARRTPEEVTPGPAEQHPLSPRRPSAPQPHVGSAPPHSP